MNAVVDLRPLASGVLWKKGSGLLCYVRMCECVSVCVQLAEFECGKVLACQIGLCFAIPNNTHKHTLNRVF